MNITYLNNPSYVFENIFNKKQQQKINYKKRQKEYYEIEKSIKILDDVPLYKYRIFSSLNNSNQEIENKKLYKSNSEGMFQNKNSRNNPKNIHIKFIQKLLKKTNKFENKSLNVTLKNFSMNKIKSLNKSTIKSHYSLNPTIDYKNNEKDIFKLKLSIFSKKKVKKFEYKKKYLKSISKIYYDYSKFNRNKSLNLSVNYSKKNYIKNTISSKLNEKPKILHKSKSFDLISKEEKRIIKSSKSIKQHINMNLFLNNKFFNKKKLLYCEKEKNIIKSLNETKFIENIIKKEDDNIHGIKHRLKLLKLQKDLDFVEGLNNSVVFSLKKFLINKYGDNIEKKNINNNEI